MKNANAAVFEKLYSDWALGKIDEIVQSCAPSLSFQISGKSRLAGKYIGAEMKRIYDIRQELSGGTYVFEIHDVLVSDLHATILGTVKLMRAGKSLEYRTVHVWRMGGGKPLAGYEYPRDLYQYDSIWS